MNQKNQKNVTNLLHAMSIIAILFILALFIYCLSTLGKVAAQKKAVSNKPQTTTEQVQPETDTGSLQTLPESESQTAFDSNTPTSDTNLSNSQTDSDQNRIDNSIQNSFSDCSNESTQESPLISSYLSDDYITYQTGFYSSSISPILQSKIDGVSYHENDNISFDDLRFLSILYVNFEGDTKVGELICNKAIEQDILEIFSALYEEQYAFEKIRLVDEYGADDDLSCADNNTSCFNYRQVIGSTSLSKHALGLAIDINPFYNPYVTYPDGAEHISPQGSEPYADRSNTNVHMIKKGDFCYELFISHGFTWGGNWKTLKDYQHFQKSLD